MLAVVETLFPLIFTIALGMALAKKNFLGESFFSELNQFIFWVGLPLLIIKSLASASSIPRGTIGVFAVFLLASLLLTGLAFALRHHLQLSRFNLGAFLQGSYRGNLAFIAIPIVMFAMRNHSPSERNEALTLVIFVFAPTMVYYNVVSVVILMKCHAKAGEFSAKKTWTTISTNPLIASSAIGVILFSLPVQPPAFLMQSMEYVGNMSGPAALLCVGGGMAQAQIQDQWKGPCAAALLKVFILPSLAYACAKPFGLSPISTFVLLVMSASPTAVASYVVTKAMKGDENMASSTIVLSTLLSIISLSFVIAWFTP